MYSHSSFAQCGADRSSGTGSYISYGGFFLGGSTGQSGAGGASSVC